MELQALQQECLAQAPLCLCETALWRCKSLVGAAHAEVMLVGEGPGANEDEQGLPFVGKSGQLLDHYLEAVDLSRDKNVYIANIVKCRPPQNRDPLPEESALRTPGCASTSNDPSSKSLSVWARVARERCSTDLASRFPATTVNFSTSRAHCSWRLTTPQRCCATQTTSPLSLATLWPCGRKSQRSATIPIKSIPPDARRKAAWSLKRWH